MAVLPAALCTSVDRPDSPVAYAQYPMSWDGTGARCSS